MQRGKRIFTHQTLVDENSVFEVVAAPAHERHEQVLAERELAAVGGRTIREAIAKLDLVALLDDRLLVEASSRVAAAELLKVVAPDAILGIVRELRLAGRKLAVLGDDDHFCRDVSDNTVGERRDDDLRVLGSDAFKAGTDIRTLRSHQRHALTHHVRSHERTVGVVVFKERDETGSDRNNLHRRNIHILDFVSGLVAELCFEAASDLRLCECHVAVERRVCLRNHKLLFLVGGEVFDFVGHLAANNFAVRRLDKAETVDLSIDAQ